MKPKTRIRDILFPEGGKARKKLRKINRFLHGKKINDPEEHIRNAYDEWMELTSYLVQSSAKTCYNFGSF